MITLEKHIVEEIARIGEYRKPAEACGVLLPFPWNGQQVFEMPNRSMNPHTSFEIKPADIALVLADWITEHDEPGMWDQITIWHTHPSGYLGPSKVDLDNKIPNCGNLVISLIPGDPKPTWF